jgi:hypothetical protein
MPAVVVGGAVTLQHGADLAEWGAFPVTMESIDAVLAVVAEAARSGTAS